MVFVLIPVRLVITNLVTSGMRTSHIRCYSVKLDGHE